MSDREEGDEARGRGKGMARRRRRTETMARRAPRTRTDPREAGDRPAWGRRARAGGWRERGRGRGTGHEVESLDGARRASERPRGSAAHGAPQQPPPVTRIHTRLPPSAPTVRGGARGRTHELSKWTGVTSSPVRCSRLRALSESMCWRTDCACWTRRESAGLRLEDAGRDIPVQRERCAAGGRARARSAGRRRFGRAGRSFGRGAFGVGRWRLPGARSCPCPRGARRSSSRAPRRSTGASRPARG